MAGFDGLETISGSRKFPGETGFRLFSWLQYERDSRGVGRWTANGEGLISLLWLVR